MSETQLVECEFCGARVRDYRFRHHLKVWHPNKVSTTETKDGFFPNKSKFWPEPVVVEVDARSKR